MPLKLAPWPVVGDAASGDGDAASGDGDAASGDGDAASGDGDAASGDGDAAWRSRELPLPSKLTGLGEEEEADGEAPVRTMLENVMLQPAGAVS